MATEVQVGGPTGVRGAFSASGAGSLVYLAGGGLLLNSRLAWVDRMGRQIETQGDEASYTDIELSPDGKRVAAAVTDSFGRNDIWLLDAGRGTRARFTFDASDDSSPIWSPDAQRVMFGSTRRGYPYDVSADGQRFLVNVASQ